MDFEEYRVRGKEMVDYIADYLENIRDRRVFPEVKPGYIRELVPAHAPLEPENWDAIFADIERVVMPGMTHWQSPYMHAYFPALNSIPSLLGDMLADAINCLGFTWASSPACTELETVVMNWLGKMVGLPEEFLHTRSDSKGGGVIQTNASESTFISLLAGRTTAIQRIKEIDQGLEDAEINSRLVAYCSDQAHSSVEKAGLIGLVQMRYIETDENLSLRGDKLREAIARDREKGLVPFFLCATLGTTGACSFDNLEEVGPICKEEGLWLHVDAAYAGSAFICPEFRKWLGGVNYADSIAFNPSKWLMVHFDCTAMWVKNSGALHRTFNVEPLYLQHENSGLAIDYMHWQIGLSKRFRSLKLWFVIRRYGIKGLQAHIREGVRLAQNFEALVLADTRFEIPFSRHLGMVVLRLRGDNILTERLLKRLNSRGNIHCVPASLKGKYVIRFTVTSSRTTLDDIKRDWTEIKTTATDIICESQDIIATRQRVPLGDAVSLFPMDTVRRILTCGMIHKVLTQGEPQYLSERLQSQEEVSQRSIRHGDLLHFPRVRHEFGRRRFSYFGPKLYNDLPQNLKLCSVPNFKKTRIKNIDFGSSLLLAHSPMSPKIVNGSFAAIFEFGDGPSSPINQLLSMQAKDSPAMRRRIRGILMSGKQFSLDSRMDLVQGFRPIQQPQSPGYDLPGTLEEDESDPKISESNGEDGGGRHSRSRSVDHSNGSAFNSFDQGTNTPTGDANRFLILENEVCQKCGHQINTNKT